MSRNVRPIVAFWLAIGLAVVIGGGTFLAASCATTKHAIAEGTVAFLECEDGHLDAKALADAKEMAKQELRHLLTGSKLDAAALKADLAPLKSDLARCGWAAAIAAIGALFPQPSDPQPGEAVSALVAAGPDPAAVRAAFAVAARANGWPAMRVSGGETL